MRLIIEGNAVYEVDQECMNRGINQRTGIMQGELQQPKDRQRMQGEARRP